MPGRNVKRPASGFRPMPLGPIHKLALVWAYVAGSLVEHLVADPVEQRILSACSTSRQRPGSWQPTPPDAIVERCQKCVVIGQPGGWGHDLVREGL